MLLDEIHDFVRENVPEHIRLWAPDGETQLLFEGSDPIRIPYDGNGTPNFDDTAYHPPLGKLRALGITGWNWVDGRSLSITIDVDALDHAAGFSQETIDDIVARLSLVAEVEIIRSKGGKGIHVRVYFDPEKAPHSRTRADHIAVGHRVLAWLSSRIGHDLQSESDAVGVVAWIYHIQRAENGFQVIKQSTAFMPAEWEKELPKTSKAADDFFDEPAMSMPLTPKHQAVIDELTRKGEGGWKDGRLTTHTYHLATLAEDSRMKIAPGFATIATGKGGSSDRNCFAYPGEGGSWKVYRFGKNVAEHSSWWKSPNGHTMTIFNRGRETKVDVPSAIVALAKDDELFHDPTGRAFVTTNLRSVKETVLLGDAKYKAGLRLKYTAQSGRIATAENVKTALAQLEAIALLERPELPVAIRIAEHGGKLYIDLANRERQVVEVSRDGWRLVADPPVRFLRPFGMLPLPVPVAGGSADDLKRFVNVEDAELPLLLAFIVGCFHPTGPYSLLQIVGEQGSAKSSLMRFVHDLVDPQLAVGNTLPKDERDLLVAAQQRWLVSFDNVDALNRKLSSLFCMLVTGAASANRKLFSDADQSILRAKRPIILTAIANVVTASDLLDRTLTLVLPPILAEARKSEFAIAQELRREGVRGRILGYILDGVASALAGHASVQRDDMPRLADLFSWATAAEAGLGLPEGSTIDAYKQQAAEEAGYVGESPFGRHVIQLCKQGWKGTAKELATEVDPGMNARDIANHLREIAPDLRRTGNVVAFKKTNGVRVIELSSAA